MLPWCELRVIDRGAVSRDGEMLQTACPHPKCHDNFVLTNMQAMAMRATVIMTIQLNLVEIIILITIIPTIRPPPLIYEKVQL